MQRFPCKGYNETEVVFPEKEGAKRDGRMDCIVFPSEANDTISSWISEFLNQ
jgi:hypothetical protein